MKGFTTAIKTPYTSVPVSKKEKFETPYSSKKGRVAISGENRSTSKRYASRLIK